MQIQAQSKQVQARSKQVQVRKKQVHAQSKHVQAQSKQVQAPNRQIQATIRQLGNIHQRHYESLEFGSGLVTPGLQKMLTMISTGVKTALCQPKDLLSTNYLVDKRVCPPNFDVKSIKNATMNK